MGANYRCGRHTCRKRVTLRKPIKQYIRPKICPECKQDSLHSTRYDNEYDSKRTCKCSGIGWPHRKGLILDAYRTCHFTDPLKIEELEFNDGLNIHTSQIMSTKDDCPF